MKRILKSRRGAAIESALFFMLVVFALSMLLLASITAMDYHNLANDRAAERHREIEQIGLYFVAGQGNISQYAAQYGYEGEQVMIDGNKLTLKSKNGKVLLYIEKSDQGVKKWCYGELSQE